MKSSPSLKMDEQVTFPNVKVQSIHYEIKKKSFSL